MNSTRLNRVADHMQEVLYACEKAVYLEPGVVDELSSGNPQTVSGVTMIPVSKAMRQEYQKHPATAAICAEYNEPVAALVREIARIATADVGRTTQYDRFDAAGFVRIAIEEILTEAGAEAINKTYINKHLAGLEFRITIEKLDDQERRVPQPLHFRLPVQVDAAFTILRREVWRTRNENWVLEQAERVAWRILRDWVRVQIGLVQMGQVELPQVFMAYLLVTPYKTVYQRLQDTGFKMLNAPKEGT